MIKKWYQLSYINKRDWLLENLEKLKISSPEAILIMLIDYYNSNNIKISDEDIIRKMAINQLKLNKLLESLCVKGYLRIETKRGLKFDLSPLYETKFEAEHKVDKSIIELFESEFSKPLSRHDFEKINEFVNNYPKNRIIKALQLAIAYNKPNTAYVETILKNELKK